MCLSAAPFSGILALGSSFYFIIFLTATKKKNKTGKVHKEIFQLPGVTPKPKCFCLISKWKLEVLPYLWGVGLCVFKRARKPLTMRLYIPWAPLLVTANQKQM